MQQHAVFLNSHEDSIRIGRVFAEERDTEISGFISARNKTWAKGGYFLQSPWWQNNGIPISAKEFRHICLLISAINSNGLPDGVSHTHDIPKEPTWNA